MRPTMSNIEETFNADRARLVGACERVAEALRPSDRVSATHLAEVAKVLRDPSPWEMQASAAASLRSLFHRDGLDDRPPPAGSSNWDEDLKTLWSLSTIYVETFYAPVAAKHALPPGTQGA